MRASASHVPVPTVDQATEELAAASMLGGSALFLDVKGGQAERVANRVGELIGPRRRTVPVMYPGLDVHAEIYGLKAGACPGRVVTRR